MQGQTLPIKLQEHAKLQELGVNAASISFSTLTMESGRFICARELVNDTPQVVIIDLSKNNEMTRRPIRADSVIMHPVEKIMALKAQRELQVYNLDNKSKICSCTMPTDVTFWKWIDENTLGLVTMEAVYHWPIYGDKEPERVFERHPSLANCQIINYRVSSDGKWMILNGIYPDGQRVAGSIQLYSRARGATQVIPGHAAAFSEFQLDDAPSRTKLFAFVCRDLQGAKLQISEIDQVPNFPFQKKIADIPLSAEQMNDFPVAMQISSKYGVIYIITKFGFIYLCDLESGFCFYTNRISSDTIFVTAEHRDSSGIIGVNRKGSVLSISLDENNVIHHILHTCNNAELAIKLASRGGFPGVDDMYITRFNQLYSSGNYSEAAKWAAKSPRGILRTPETLERFKQLSNAPGQAPPILQYLGILLEKGELNKHESIELAKPILLQNRKELLEKWLKADKLECSEELGDFAKQYDSEIALSVYLRANAPHKVVQWFAENRRYDKILEYASTIGYTPNYEVLFRTIAQTDSENAPAFATKLANNMRNNERIPLLEPEKIVDIFQYLNMVPQATAFLLDYLAENREGDAGLQTRLLEMNLVYAPQVADAILGEKRLTHYDHVLIGSLCEKAQLYTRALEHYSDIHDIKRIIPNMHTINKEWLVEYFGRLSVDQTLVCLREMLTINLRQNLSVVVQVATKYSEQLEPHNLVDIFEDFKTNEGLYHYLGSIVNVSQDPLVHFKYIQAACRTGNVHEAERICRVSDYYDPENVKNFLKEAKLSDQLPLIIVCDRFDFMHDLVLYLYHNGLQKYIEVYVQKVNPKRTPEVVGGLLDVGCDEDVIKNLLLSVTGDLSVEKLCYEAEKRDRLQLLLPWLDGRAKDGSTEPEVYNALAKIYIDTNKNPKPFLQENEYYDKQKIGDYCEKRDPSLAYVCYAKGQCDYQLIYVTTENSMFKDQARYVVQRRDPKLWHDVLKDSNAHRQELLDEVSQSAIPECTDPEEVVVAVKALQDAQLPNELVDLLKKIVLENSAFNDNRSLQTLLLFTTIEADPLHLSSYVSQLDNFDHEAVATGCIHKDLFEEAFEIYKKYNQNVKAAEILVDVDQINDLDRAYEFADSCNEPEVWSKLAKAQLDGMHIKEAIESYIRANDMKNYKEVTELAYKTLKYDDLVRYLETARKELRLPFIDSELLFAYAKTGRLTSLEDILASTNLAKVEDVGERCFNDHLFEAAKLLYGSISNHANLARTLVHLKDYHGAVDSARKAKSTRVWKEVNAECIQQREFRLAQVCGLHIVVRAEELDGLVKTYERGGFFMELIHLLEAGLGLERAHMGMFTSLAILYANHATDKLMDYLQLYVSRLNIPKVIPAVVNAHLWREVVFLHVRYGEYDKAASTIMDHSGGSWEHSAFKDIIAMAKDEKLHYKALTFYRDQHPLLLNDLLAALKSVRIKAERVVELFKKSDNTPLIKSYLVSIQEINNKMVNAALNELYVEEEDSDALRDSIDHYNNIDALALAKELEEHELTEFRRIAAHLYAKNKQWNKSITLCKVNRQFKDAMSTAAKSGDREVVKDLLVYFVETGNHHCFAAMLYICYDQLRPDIVMELAWSNGLKDLAMPYMINFIHEQRMRIGALDNDVKELEKKKIADPPSEDNAINMPPLMNQLMLPAPMGM